MMINFAKFFLSFILFFSFGLNVFAQNQQNPLSGLNNLLKGSTYEDDTETYTQTGEAGVTDISTGIVDKVGYLVKFALTFVGSILFLIIIYSGITWMTAGDDSGKIKQAKTWVTNGVIGAVIISIAYFLTDFVVKILG